MTVRVEKHLFSIEEYYKMVDAGIFTEDDRVELIEGEVVEMSPIGSRHAACVKRLNALLSRLSGVRFIVSVQDPIRLSERSEPEPDLALLKRREDFYAERHPHPEDVLLLAEVADTSIEYDRSVKLPLYARSGIPEVWILDPDSGTVEVHAGPNPSLPGGYETVRRVGRDSELRSETVEGLTLRARDVLG
jgi:Uma2 family endonuclease